MDNEKAGKIRGREPLTERLRHAAHAPVYMPPAMYANLCGEAEKELRTASRAFKTLTRAIEAEGYDVLVDVDGAFSVRRRDSDTDQDKTE